MSKIRHFLINALIVLSSLGSRWDIIAVRSTEFFCNFSLVSYSERRMLRPFFPSYRVIHGMYLTTYITPFPHFESSCSFMGPLAGVMCSDYYLVRKGKLNVKELYNPYGLYKYDGGWNWRAYVSFLYVLHIVLTQRRGI